MSATYEFLTPAQVVALRSQAERLMNESDEQFVAFFKEHHGLLEKEEFADFAAKAEEAYDRQAENEAKASYQWRQTAAGIFADKGFHEAAVAVMTELDDADGETLNWVNQTLIQDIRESGLYGQAKHWAYVHANAAHDRAQIKAEETAAKLISWLISELSKAEDVLDSAAAVPSGVHAGLLRQAQYHFGKAGEIRFAGWALSALERMMDSQNRNAVTDILREDPDLAGAVVAAPERQRATALLNGLKSSAAEQIAAFEKKILERREKSREKSAVQSERQLERAADCQRRKGRHSSESGSGKSQLGKRAAGDPHYRGPNKR